MHPAGPEVFGGVRAPRRGPLRRGARLRLGLNVLALCCTGGGFLWGVTALAAFGVFGTLLPAGFAEGRGPWLIGLVSVGLALAVAALPFGARKASAGAAFLGMTAVLVSLVPATRLWEPPPLGSSPPERSSPAARDGVSAGETEVYARPGGEELALDVREPTGGEDSAVGRPAVVMVHGGGWRTGARGGMPVWNEWFADRGYVVFDIDYRLAPQPRWQSTPDDVKCAVGWVKRNAARYDVDPSRIALVGYSAGGHLALLFALSGGGDELPAYCGVADPSVAAVAAFYPPTDLTRLYDMEWPWSRPNVVGLDSTTGFLGGTPDSLPARFRLASPVTHVGPKDPPTFLVHGVEDRVVPFEQSRLLAERLREAGVPNRLLPVPGAGHSFDHDSDLSWEEPDTRMTRRALSEFLRFSLGTQGGPRKEPSGG